MSRVCVFFANGFEEIEALTVVDILRRANVIVHMVSVTGEKKVTGSHNIVVEANQLIEEVDFEQTDMIVLPGGMPGTANLEACEPLMKQVDAFFAEGKYIAAICAAPSILGHRGMLQGKKACSSPGFESHLEGAAVKKKPVVVAGQIITSRGMGTAIPFGLAILEQLKDKNAVAQMKDKIVFKTKW
ncbi:MAG: DJ-1/PfpI family protein [Lachnospiraceae bacterium]|nr:DJ-1/PfpI family protein [Lachnospiraceae bacterium]